MEYPPLHLAQHLQALLAIFMPLIRANHPARIQKSMGHIRKVKATMLKALATFGFVPLKIYCAPL